MAGIVDPLMGSGKRSVDFGSLKEAVGRQFLPIVGGKELQPRRKIVYVTKWTHNKEERLVDRCPLRKVRTSTKPEI